MKIPKALQTKLLPQYRESEDVMARFLVAAHDEAGPDISRTEYEKGDRSVRATELQLDAFDYFLSDINTCETKLAA